MNIENLLEQYFEGRTSTAEDAQLRRFFTTADVPEHLLMYKPLFAYFEHEIKKSNLPKSSGGTLNGKRFMLFLSGIAASVAILSGIFFYSSPSRKCPLSGNYVMIDGRCFTDAATIRSTTLKTLHEIAKDDAFLPDDKPSAVSNMIENQLKEFDFLLNE